MRPVMGAPDDTPQIHGLCDQIEALKAEAAELRRKLTLAEATIHSLQAAMAKPAAARELLDKWLWAYDEGAKPSARVVAETRQLS